MRARITKTVNGKFYLCAAKAKENSLWLNRNKVSIERKSPVARLFS
jgi:hypothetical protein